MDRMAGRDDRKVHQIDTSLIVLVLDHVISLEKSAANKADGSGSGEDTSWYIKLRARFVDHHHAFPRASFI